MKKMTFGFTLLELCVVSVIIGVTSVMAISTVWQSIPAIEAKEGLRTLEQTLLLAKSTAVRQSRNIVVDFSQAKTNNGNNGGIIKIEYADYTVINTYSLNKFVLVDNSSTTGNYVRFDYRGQPIDSSGNSTTTANNTLAITYNKGNGSLALKQLTISPITGNIDQLN